MLLHQSPQYRTILFMGKYPIFLELNGRRVVVIGGGIVAARKISSLLNTGARLVVVSKQIDDVVLNLFASHPNVELVRSTYSKDYISGAAIVIAATDNQQINAQIYKDCQELEILCNVVDAPKLCDFFIPAVVKRGDLQIAICTEGDCPAYSGHIRKKLEEIFTEEHGEFLTELEKIRNQIITDVPDPTVRKAILGEIVADKSFDYFKQNGPAKWFSRAQTIITEYAAKATS